MMHQSKPLPSGTDGITASDLPPHVACELAHQSRHPDPGHRLLLGDHTDDVFCQPGCAGADSARAAGNADRHPAVAIVDMHDRRIVGLVALSIELCGATALTVLAWLGLTTPNLLLALCFAVGSGTALMGPAWQSSVSEQVPSEALPATVALNGISYNISRSADPAVGVAAAGAVAFPLNPRLYLPLMLGLFLWPPEPSRLPP